MNILALIPARGGSKRIPGKNIKLLCGLPMIAWSIRAAKESGACTEIRVSTDDRAIADVAIKFGAMVPNLRPQELSTDTAGSVEVAIHELDIYESTHGAVDGLLLLQPTSPLRTAETIKRGVQLFLEHKGMHPVTSVSPASSHPAWCFRITSTGLDPFLGWENIGKRSQDLEPAYMLNGAIYLITPSRLRQERSFLTRDTLPLVMENSDEAIDIDTPDDWKLAQSTLSNRLNKSN
jgi:CMP-N,N'-diacetyllegionaminic acid synthase